MICLVPISRFRVTFEVAAGRPFSQLERMVLRAIQEGVTDLDQMESTFQVHPRILIEALVTLTQAGWVSLSSLEGGGFLLTSEGATATAEGQIPSTTSVTSKTTFLLLERLTGGLIANDEVRFKSRAQLETVWDDAVRLRADVHDNLLDEAQVRQLLPRRQGEWVRWVGPIDMVSKGAHWVPVGVDTASGTLVGLPDRWRPRLGSVILEEAKRRESTMSPSARVKQWDREADGGERLRSVTRQDEDVRSGTSWSADIGAADLLFDGTEHQSALLKALEEAASSVFVASAFLGKAAIEALKEPMLSALRRGINLDLLWGYDGGAEQGDAVLQMLKKLAYEARRDGYSGALRFNLAASGSHAKLLIHDSPTGMVATVGSFNWLSSFGAPAGGTNVSITLRHQGLVAEACSCAASLWASAESEALSSTADRWRSLAADLEKTATSANQLVDESLRETPSAAVRLVFDREHEAIVRELQAAGYDSVTIDPKGYRAGSLNEGLILRQV